VEAGELGEGGCEGRRDAGGGGLGGEGGGDHLSLDDVGAFETPEGVGELLEEDVLDGPGGRGILAEVGEEGVEAGAVLDEGTGGEAVGCGVLGGALLAFGGCGAAGLGSVGAGGGLLLV
jgi:hypothetical protein